MRKPYRAPVAAGIHLSLGILAFVLAVTSVIKAGVNHDLQHTSADNAAKIEQARELGNLDNSLIQLMAKSASDTNDGALTALLANNGVTFHKSTDAGAGK